MSKNSGLGRKRIGSRVNKGMDRCDVASHGKQCGRLKKVYKGHQIPIERQINPEPQVKGDPIENFDFFK